MTQFWMIGPGDGTYAHVDGPTRDRLLPFGWKDSDEPAEAEAFVWVRKDGFETPGRLPFQSLPFWLSVGWLPGAPPEHVDPTTEPPAAAPASKPPAAEKPVTAAKNPKE